MIAGTGALEPVKIRETSEATLNDRGTAMEKGKERLIRTKAVIDLPTARRDDKAPGGQRPINEITFYVPSDTVEYPSRLVERPISVEHRGQIYSVVEVRDWHRSHQELRAERPDGR